MTRNRAGHTARLSASPLLSVGAALIAAAGSAVAGVALELESHGEQRNNSIETAQRIDPRLFSENISPNVFGSLPTATVLGVGGGDDVDFFRFRVSRPGIAFFDIDTTTNVSTRLALFDEAGGLMAFDAPLADGQTAAPDAGSAEGVNDAFLGVVYLPKEGVYFLAVSSGDNGPLAAGDAFTIPGAGNADPRLSTMVRPDGAPDGFAFVTPEAGDGVYARSGAQSVEGGGGYRLSLSIANPEEPSVASVLTFGAEDEEIAGSLLLRGGGDTPPVLGGGGGISGGGGASGGGSDPNDPQDPGDNPDTPDVPSPGTVSLFLMTAAAGARRRRREA